MEFTLKYSCTKTLSKSLLVYLQQDFQALLQKQDVICTRHVNYRDGKSAERNDTIHQLEDGECFQDSFKSTNTFRLGKKLKLAVFTEM